MYTLESEHECAQFITDPGETAAVKIVQNRPAGDCSGIVVNQQLPHPLLQIQSALQGGHADHLVPGTETRCDPRQRRAGSHPHDHALDLRCGLAQERGDGQAAARTGGLGAALLYYQAGGEAL